jgi:hypothetical protein
MPEPLPIFDGELGSDCLGLISKRTGELGESEVASRLLLDTIELMVRQGTATSTSLQ